MAENRSGRKATNKYAFRTETAKSNEYICRGQNGKQCHRYPPMQGMRFTNGFHGLIRASQYTEEIGKILFAYFFGLLYFLILHEVVPLISVVALGMILILASLLPELTVTVSFTRDGTGEADEECADIDSEESDV